jgi:hypothetical protein
MRRVMIQLGPGEAAIFDVALSIKELRDLAGYTAERRTA